MNRLLIAPLMVATVFFAGGEALAQGAFPAPLPGQTGQADQPSANGNSPSATIVTPPTNAFPSDGAPPVAGIGATPPFQFGDAGECTNGFAPLREEAERKRKLIMAAGERHAPPEEACKLVGSYRAAEVKMIQYVEMNAARCGMLAQIAGQLKVIHRNTETLHTKVCMLARPMQKNSPPGPTGDFWPPSTDAPI